MRAKNDNGGRLCDFLCKWTGHHRNIVSAQKYLHGNMGISKWESEGSDRPSSDQKAFEICSARCWSAEGGRYQQRSLLRQDKDTDETQQVRQHEEVQAKFQHRQTEGHEGTQVTSTGSTAPRRDFFFAVVGGVIICP